MARAKVEPKPANTPADATTVRKAAPARTHIHRIYNCPVLFDDEMVVLNQYGMGRVLDVWVVFYYCLYGGGYESGSLPF